MTGSCHCALLSAVILLTVCTTEAVWAEEGDVWNSIRRLTERLEHVEMKFSEAEQQRRAEEQQWRAERLQWQQLQQNWREERQQWLDDRRKWQRQKQLLQHVAQSLVVKVTLLESPHLVSEAQHNEHGFNAMPCTEGFKTSHEIGTRSDDTDALLPVINQMNQRLDEVGAEVEALKNSVSSEVAALQNTNIRQDGAIEGAGTSTYVRWGNSACPSSAEHVYSGTVAGGDWSSAGSTSSVLCLHHKPVFGQVIHPNYIGHISGAEYSAYPGPHSDIDPLCVVCRVPRPTTIMVPGTNVCEDGWTLEYNGFLMGSEDKDPSNHESVCVDSEFVGRDGSEKNENGMLLYFLYTHCGSLPCPPYRSERVLTCAVCSK